MIRVSHEIRFGVGLVGLGYGIYRLSRGRRDWATTTALTTGFSLAVAGLTGNRPTGLRGSVRMLVSAVNRSAPRFVRQVVRASRRAWPGNYVGLGAAAIDSFL